MNRWTQLWSAGLVAASLFGCANVEVQRPPEPEMIPAQIARLEAELLQSSSASDNSRSRLELVHLYISHNNPKQDYGRALEHLEQYYQNSSATDDTAELRDWLPALRSHVALERSIKALEVRNQKLEQSNRELQELNQKLDKTINILKTLDQGVEEKRKSYNNQ